MSPADSALLNYRIVGFSFPADQKANSYRIEIAKGHYDKENAFDKHLVTTATSKTNNIIAEVPAWAEAYTWRVVSMHNSKVLGKGKMHYFRTGTSDFLDTSKFRIKPGKSAETYKSGYVFIDATRVLYDMNGQPVWYLPTFSGVLKENVSVRDMKMTQAGTITFLAEGDAYEINYNGEILWKGPNGRQTKGDTLEGYHHELTRLSNGHYMTLAFEPISKRRLPMRRDTSMSKAAIDSLIKVMRTQRKPRYGNVSEYDEKGNLVWSWQAAPYFENEDLSAYKKPNGSPEFDLHENSLYFDEKNNYVYVGFRNIAQVLKISYPSGKVVQAYGKVGLGGTAGEGLFCGQHSCKRSEDGYLYLFDNGCSLDQRPKVLMMKEPEIPGDTLKTVWEFTCPVELMQVNVPKRRMQFTSGGNAIELPDHSMFVSTCSPYSKIFIVSKDKEILWSMDAEKWNSGKREWQPFPIYRASIITDRKLLESLVWEASAR